jgi:hypothetical protein
MKQRNPLRKLELIIATLGVLAIFSLVVSAGETLTGDGYWYGFGSPVACAKVPSDALVDQDAPHHGVIDGHVTTLAPGASAHASEFELCASDPTFHQQALATLVDFSRTLFFLGFLLITWRLTRRARRDGVFTADVAAAVSRLSVYLFFGDFAVGFIRAIATQHLVGTMLTHPDDNDWLRYMHLSWVLLITAFGLQAMGRVMAAAVPMQAELDATV